MEESNGPPIDLETILFRPMKVTVSSVGQVILIIPFSHEQVVSTKKDLFGKSTQDETNFIHYIDIKQSLRTSRLHLDTVCVSPNKFLETSSPIEPAEIIEEIVNIYKLVLKQIHDATKSLDKLTQVANVLSCLQINTANISMGKMAEGMVPPGFVPETQLQKEVTGVIGEDAEKHLTREQFLDISKIITEKLNEVALEINLEDSTELDELRKEIEYKIIQVLPDAISVDFNIDIDNLVDAIKSIRENNT